MGGNGVLYGGDQLGTQLFAAAIILTWTVSWSLLIFMPLRQFGLLRLSDEFQEAGADVLEHSPRKSYSGDNPEEQERRASIRKSIENISNNTTSTAAPSVDVGESGSYASNNAVATREDGAEGEVIAL